MTLYVFISYHKVLSDRISVVLVYVYSTMPQKGTDPSTPATHESATLYMSSLRNSGSALSNVNKSTLSTVIH